MLLTFLYIYIQVWQITLSGCMEQKKIGGLRYLSLKV